MDPSRADPPVVAVEQVVESAHAASAARDPDPGAFAGNLDTLVSSLNEEGRLSRPGAAAATWMLGDALRKRIEVAAWWTEEPGVGRTPIDRPIFLTGLPRSGTTYIQYLFDRDPTIRMLRTWEGDDPCPPPAVDPASAVERRARCVETHRRRREQDGGAMDAFHLSDPDGPQECVMLLDQTFANAGHFWTFRVPGYFDSVVRRFDLRAAYEHHRRALQVLQWQAPPARWALKWPCHLLALEDILQVYPDAVFVVTHRDPVQALASNCSFSRYLRQKFSDEIDLHELGRHMKDMVGRHIRGLVDFDAAHGAASPLVHVDYAQVVAEPEAVMEQVFGTLGLELTGSVRESIVAWRSENPPGKRGVHAYDLRQFGLDVDEVADEYSFYTERFCIPREAR